MRSSPTNRKFILLAVTRPNSRIAAIYFACNYGSRWGGLLKYQISDLLQAIEDEDDSRVKKLLEEGVNANELGEQGLAPLHVAVSQSTSQILVQLLIEKGADIETKSKGSGSTPLSIAVESCSDLNTISALIDAGADINSTDEIDGDNLLIRAAGNPNSIVTQFLIDSGLGIDRKNNSGMTALMRAAGTDNHLVTKVLLENGANTEVKDDNGRTALSVAVQFCESPKAIQALVKYGADIETRDKYGYTPLIYASSTYLNTQETRSNVIVEKLISLGANVEAKDNEQLTPLLHTFSDSLSSRPTFRLVAQTLLDSGADIEAQEVDCKTPLILAIQQSNCEMVEFLLQSGAKKVRVPYKSYPMQWHFRMKDFVNNGTLHSYYNGTLHSYYNNQPRLRVLFGMTPLMLITLPSVIHSLLSISDLSNSQLKIAELLLKKGARAIEAIDEFGLTPLMHAVINNAGTEFIGFLLDRGSNPESESLSGKSALMYSVENTDIAKLLIERGADFEVRDNENNSLLIMAAIVGNEDLIDFLLDLEIDPLYKNNKGMTALDAGRNSTSRSTKECDFDRLINRTEQRRKFLQEVESRLNPTLLSRLVSWLKKVTNSSTPDILHKEIMNGDVDRIRSILDSNHIFRTRISNLPRFITYYLPRFMSTTSPEVLKLLLDNYSEIEAHDNNGRTLLMEAAGHAENPKLVQLLIDNGAEIEAQDTRGQTPLMLATSMSVTPEVVQVLIENGANLEARDNSGKTPLMHFFPAGIRRNVYTICNMMQLLLDKGAEVNARDKKGSTPLMYAVHCGDHWGPHELLIDSGADIEAKNNKGMTPLMVAANCGGYGSQSPQNVQQLLYRGANPSTKSNKGKRAIDFAEENVKLVGTEAYQLLLEKSKE